MRTVYRKKRDSKYLEREVLPSIRKMGVNVDEVVATTRLRYPYAYEEYRVRRLLGEWGLKG